MEVNTKFPSIDHVYLEQEKARLNDAERTLKRKQQKELQMPVCAASTLTAFINHISSKPTHEGVMSLDDLHDLGIRTGHCTYVYRDELFKAVVALTPQVYGSRLTQTQGLYDAGYESRPGFKWQVNK